MTKFTNPLNNLKVASPCEESWETMFGNEHKRYCGRCKLNVYNLSGMTQTEAENLLVNSEGRVCVRFYRRADGSVITQDCPVGWAKIKNRAKVLATAAFSLILSLFSGLMFASAFGKPKNLQGTIPFVFSTPEPTMGTIAVNPHIENQGEVYPIMGAVAPSTPKSSERLEMGKMKIQTIKEETKRKILAEDN